MKLFLIEYLNVIRRKKKSQNIAKIVIVLFHLILNELITRCVAAFCIATQQVFLSF